VKARLTHHRFGGMLALAVVVALISTGAHARSVSVGSASPITNPAAIQKLAAKAYVWGLPPEFVYRFLKFNTLATAPLNTLGGGNAAAAWNNNATNAGDASVLYLNAMIDLSGQKGRGGTKELVLTVPPSSTNYYVVNLLDDFINTVGGIGTRTTPSARAQTYLIVGPTSPYAHKRIVRIHGFIYRVVPYDTNFGWILIRIRADSLVPASDPVSVASILKNVVERFAMSSLAQFEARGHRPKYFKPGQYTPTPAQLKRAAKWHNAPTRAVAFFKQMGASLRLNPLPTARTGLNGIPLSSLPSWISPQSGAIRRYRNPSYPQQHTLALFKPLGLTANGFRVPSNWGPKQINALQAGMEAGQASLNALLSSGGATASTNFWNYLNHSVGTYPNTPQGYQYRGLIVLAGGSANLALDAVYPQLNSLNGTSATTLDGNNTYKLTFTPPVTNPATLPVVGSLPPTVNDSQGNPRGFWSIHAYQTDTTQSAAPFITQASVLNTAYSTANIPVTAVDPSTDTITVEPSAWGPLVASSPILFGATAANYGLTPGVPYYVATTPIKQTDPTTRTTTYSFKISTKWLQQLSAANVPIQGHNGTPGPIVQLTNSGGPVNLQWGPIQPVSQLGSQQLTSGKLVKNADGSVTLWIAPTLPPGAPATNWLPTPSTAYYATLYPGVQVPTQIRLLMRIYYPAPGSNTQASILPPPNGSMGATYVFPALQKVG
jgi:hypothetical protein